MSAEIIGDFDVERAIRIGEALELDAELLAHDAARTLPAHQIAASDRLVLAGCVDDMGNHTVGALLERGELGCKAHVDIRMRLRHLERLLDDLDALALQHIGEAGVVLEMDMVEFGDQLLLVAVPVVKHRCDDPARLDPLVEADAVEHFQRRRMVGPRPRHLIEKIVLAQRLDHHDPHVRLRQRQRQA